MWTIIVLAIILVALLANAPEVFLVLTVLIVTALIVRWSMKTNKAANEAKERKAFEKRMEAYKEAEKQRKEAEELQKAEKEVQWEFQIRSGNLPVNQSLKEDNRSNYFITMRVIGSDGNFVDLQSIKFGDSMDALTFARDIRHKLYSDCVVRKAETGTAYVVIASEVSTLTLHQYQSNVKKVYEFVNPVYDVYNQSDDEDDEEYISAPPKYTTGLEYERYVAQSLKTSGCENVEVTPASGDFGADIIFRKNGAKVCAQCKLYSKPVGISAVQEVIGAKAHYKCAAAMVITNSTFTEKAEEFAGKAKVSLKTVVPVSRYVPPSPEPKKRRNIHRIIAGCIFAVVGVVLVYAVWHNHAMEDAYINSPEGQQAAQELKESQERLERAEELQEHIEEIGTAAEKTVADIESIGDIEVENKLLTVTLTMPADFVTATTQEELEESAKETGDFISVKLNDDGTATYVMTKSAHKELMDTTRAGFEQQLQEMVRSEDYPNITEIKVNDDFTKFEVTTENEETDFAESFSVMLFYMMSGTYHVFNGTTPDNCQVIFYNAQTGAVIQEANSSEIGD